MDIKCGPLTFSGHFDSGNLGNVELVRSSEDAGGESSNNSYSIGADYEVNVWTKQDCAGTKYANGNRTWFYFGVSGGKPNGLLRLNILNLNKQTKLFEQGMQPVTCCMPEKPKWERVKDRVVVLGDAAKDHSCGISFRQKLPADTRSSTLFIAFTYPFSYENMASWLNDIDNIYCDVSPRTDNPLVATSDIYYKRETVCLSLEGRPVDLLTITSNDGMLTSCREEYLDNLFPYRDHQERCCKFINKKVVFLSSRVHPGEVPAQFVMNGVIKFLLEEKDPRARLLRRLFVFKLIPILNPDGVYRGHYRTDPRGVNLNRVYLQPSPTLHPSIYAARKLILYAHWGQDKPDDYEIENESPAEPETELEEIPNVEETNSEYTENKNCDGRNRLCAGCIDLPENSLGESENVLLDDADQSRVQMADPNDVENVPVISNPGKGLLLLDNQDGHQCTFESCDEDSIIDYNELRKSSGAGNEFRSPDSFPSSSSASGTSLVSLPIPQLKVQSPLTRRSRHSITNLSSGLTLPEIKLIPPSLPSSNNSKRSQQMFVIKPPEVESGLFAYIDFHGHATKRGIFMYGNHFNDASVQTECMLLPRLVAMNSPHFDFSSCNFTEKLMTMRDRRDGASREGSGRVAVLKLTGLVRSYTLECNYNTGRLVNHLISRPDSCGFVDPLPTSIHPPKFTPELFETVGKSMLESILDLTEMNPWSRLKSTEFRNLDGLRGFLRRRLEHTIEYKASTLSHRTPSTAVAGGSKSNFNSTSTAKSTGVNRGKSYTAPESPSVKKRASSAKISYGHTSSQPSSSGPLFPKKDNQPPAVGSSANMSGSKSGTKQLKAPVEKPVASCSTTPAKAKFKLKLSKSMSLPTVGPKDADLLPSSSSSDNRSSVTKLTQKLSTTKKKKKTIKRKSKKGTKSFQRPESR